jgi:2-oxo-hept-3-ene-1,7-dioate hydratase
MRWAAAILYRNENENIEETGLGAAVLGHPARSVAWLANTIAVSGGCLEPGDIVLAGSFIKPVPASGGDVLRADYGQLGVLGFKLQRA